MTAERLRPEHRALLCLSIPAMTTADVESTKQILQGPIDWGVLLDAATRQYVLPLIARNLAKESMLEDGPGGERLVPNAHALLFEHAYFANRLRNEALRDEVEIIADRAHRVGLDIVLRKGLALGVGLYGDHGVRVSSDIDFLVRRSDGRQAVDLLTELGFVAGVANRSGRLIDRWSDAGERLMYLSVPNLPQMVRTTGRLEIPAVSVGFTTGLFERNAHLRYDVAPIFDRTVPIRIGSALVPTMHQVDTLIDLCAHFFKDAKSLFAIEYGKDLTLLKLVDIRLAFDAACAAGLLAEFQAAAVDNGLTSAMYFTLSYVHAAFPGTVPEQLLEQWRPDDELYLHRYGDNEGQDAVWTDRSLLDRLFDHTRADRKEGRSRFWGLTEGTADRMAVGSDTISER
jgi:hypothetical protein